MNCVLSVIIPVYNEEQHIKDSIQVINVELQKAGYPYELLIIDDGSKDDTWGVITNLKLEIPQLRAFRFSRNFGKESALSAGLDNARGDAVILMDCDLQHPPSLIYKMVSTWKFDGYEIVECVKTNRGRESLINKWGAKLFYGTINKMAGYKLNGASDYKLLDRKVVEAWKKLGERNIFFRGMSAWLGFKSTQIQFEVPERVAGVSNWTTLKLLKLAINAIVSFSSIPLRLVTFAGGLFLILSCIIGVQTLLNKLTGQAVTGFTTVILLLLFIGSILMISLGIIGEYTAAIYHEVKRRPRYIISQEVVECENFKKNMECEKVSSV